MRFRTIFALAASILAAGSTITAARLGAQPARSEPRAMLTGRVISSVDSTPVRTVDVRLIFVDSAKKVRRSRGDDSLDIYVDSARSRVAATDSAGAFTIRRLAPGTYLLYARRLGFGMVQGVVNADTSALHTTLAMEPTSQLLSKVTITEAAVDRVKERLDRVGYASRRNSGQSGTFIDRAEILRRRPFTVEDILSAYGIHNGEVMLDRMPLDYEDVKDYPAELIIGVEIFRRGRPTEYNMTRRGALAMQRGGGGAPLVLIWTYIP